MDGNECFKNFMRRNKKWKEMKDLHLKNSVRKKEDEEKKQIRDIPQILRGSFE